MSFARLIQCVLAFPAGAGLGEVWAGTAGAVQRELSWFAEPARCSASVLQVSGSSAHTDTSSERSYRNKTQQKVLGDLFRKSRALLGHGAA